MIVTALFLIGMSLLILVTYTFVVRPQVSVGMSQQEVRAKLNPGVLPFPKSTLFMNDRLGVYVAQRNFLIATQEIVV